MDDAANVRLILPSRPENVLVVRQALSGLAERLALDAIETNDLNTAVTEACNNVVLHAYGEREGPLEVDARTRVGAVEVVVRDRGVGLGSRRREASSSDQYDGHLDGMGLTVIEALATRVRLLEPPGGGTEVRMEFPASEEHMLEPGGTATPDTMSDADASVAPSAGGMELHIAPGTLARAILPRVLSTLAARAHFTTDRIADVRLIADVLATNAVESLDGASLAVDVRTSPRTLDLRIGPLHAGEGESVLTAAADGLAPVIERLTDAQRVAPFGDGEALELRLVDRR